MSKMFSRSRLDRISGYVVWAAVFVGMISLLAACGPAAAPEVLAPTPVTENNENMVPTESAELQSGESAYPAPAEAPMVTEAYPVDPLPVPSPTPLPDSYPVEDEGFAEPRFRIDLPLTKDDRVVIGQAPANMALAIVDVSSGGIVLGTGVSTDEGQFTIGVRGLPDGHRIGVTFSDLEPGKTYADMSVDYFPHRGEGFMNIPNIGIFFDTALVGE